MRDLWMLRTGRREGGVRENKGTYRQLRVFEGDKQEMNCRRTHSQHLCVHYNLQQCQARQCHWEGRVRVGEVQRCRQRRGLHWSCPPGQGRCIALSSLSNGPRQALQGLRLLLEHPLHSCGKGLHIQELDCQPDYEA